MPDQVPSDSQAPAAAETTDPIPASGEPPSTPDQSTATTKTTDAPADKKELTFEEADAILNQADKSARTTKDPLDDPEERSPLDDPDEADPLGLNGLDEVLPDETEEEPAAEEAPEAEVTPAPEEEAETPSASDDQPEADADGLPKRIRIKLEDLNARDAAVLLHARKTGKTFDEAKSELFGTTDAAAKGKETEAEVTPKETPETIQAEIDQLKADRRKAAKAYDSEGGNEITEKIEAAQERLSEARARVSAEQSAAQKTYDSAFASSMTRAQEAYPDAAKPGTDLHDAILSDKTRLEAVNPAFFDDPEWPETLVYKHAGKLGKVPAKAKATTETPPAAKPGQAKVVVKTPAKAARPVPGPAPGGRTGVEQNTVQVMRDRLKAAEAKGDAAEVERIMLELERNPIAA